MGSERPIYEKPPLRIWICLHFFEMFPATIGLINLREDVIMSVIFQLFCAEDLQTLKRLAPAYLEDLKATLLTISSNALPDLLKAGLTTLQSTYEHPSPQVTEAIEQRAY